MNDTAEIYSVIFTTPDDAPEYHRVSLRIDGAGNLEWHAHDMGESVERYWNHDDQEWATEVKSSDVRNLVVALLEDRFAGRSGAFQEFRAYLDEKKVIYGTWCWP